MIHTFLRSVGYGFAGLAFALRSETILRIHVCIGLGVIVASYFFALAAWEWVAVVLCIGLVISAECLNTAVERLADRVTLERDPLIKLAKDCSSAAVLVLALTTAVIGGIVLVPKLSAWLGR
jgi:diacylglycerol kinase